MSGEYVHPRDHPEGAIPPDRDTPAVVTRPEQVLTGLEIGLADLSAACSTCGERRREGDVVEVYTYRAADAPAWAIARCYCPACTPRGIETPTLGTSEAIASARLGVCSRVRQQTHALCLTAVDLLDFSPPTEGSEP